MITRTGCNTQYKRQTLQLDVGGARRGRSSTWAELDVGGARRGRSSTWAELDVGGARRGRSSTWAELDVGGARRGRSSTWAELDVGGARRGRSSTWAELDVGGARRGRSSTHDVLHAANARVVVLTVEWKLGPEDAPYPYHNSTNRNGTYLTALIMEHELLAANTMFRKRTGKRWTFRDRATEGGAKTEGESTAFDAGAKSSSRLLETLGQFANITVITVYLQQKAGIRMVRSSCSSTMSLHTLGLPLALLLLMLGSDDGVTGSRVDKRPNFVLIMVDDLGIGDVGCYGNNTIRTPNIDRLSREGVRLSQHMAAAPLCTPSRAAFLTGRYALRSGLGSHGRVQVLLFLGGSGGLPPTETTFAKRLQKQGYTTGLVGKWHLGVNCESRGDHCHHPNHHGFHYFYGLPFTLFNNCVPGARNAVCLRVCGLLRVSGRLLALLTCVSVVSVALWFVPFGFLQTWNCIVMRNQEVVEQPMALETLTERMLKEAQNFISRNADRPFLLFFSLAHVHTPLFHSPAFAGKSRHGVYGDNVEEMDWIVGQVTETVDSLGLASNTMMYFTSDHGGHVENGERGGWNGIYKGGKAMGGWEGGIRVPGIFRWPSRLPAGRVVDEPTSLMDLYPTLKHLAQDTQTDRPDADMKLYKDKIAGLLREFEKRFQVHYFTPNFSPPDSGGCHHEHICRCDGEHVTYHDPPLVYDLSRDPSESRPLTPATEPRHGEILLRTGEAAASHRDTLTEEAGRAEAVPSQMSWDNVLWKPWLQPCCGTFPFCGCRDNASLTA
ncbi:hypothetical protein NHX12_007842 [Muraenolepis orangiensis]|uniref:Sulfatase N-terminal domain-containing protein n=1 Tax=Muraenolepis orangiensis TaxID=630683 RepID=A0A9Q0DT78_9TELE|nr:hypothetical protein NHX12_007842 [Muraenolepis orangiensis]